MDRSQQQHQHQQQHQSPLEGHDLTSSNGHLGESRQLLAYISGGNQCQNCQTNQTCMWRRGGESGDMMLCNKCGLYFARKGYHRPQLNRKPTVRRRTNTKRVTTDLGQDPNSGSEFLSVPSSSSTPSPSSLAYHQHRPTTNAIQKQERMTTELNPLHYQRVNSALHSVCKIGANSSSGGGGNGSINYLAPQSSGHQIKREDTGGSVLLSVSREQAADLLREIQKAVSENKENEK